MTLEIKVSNMPAGALSAIVTRWHVKSDDAVVCGQLLAELESSGFVIALHAPASGVIKEIRCLPGSKVKSSYVLALLEESAEDGEGTELRFTPPKESPTFLQKAAAWGPQFKHALNRGSQYCLMFLGVVFVALTFYKAADGSQILLTKTPSLNPGWYLLDPGQPLSLQRGEIVRWNYVPPAWLREWHPELPAKPYLKRVAGIPGDSIYWNDDELIVCPPDHRETGCTSAGKAAPHDGTGHAFPRSVFPEVIPEDQYLLIADHPLSIDSRYLGLIPINAVTGRAREWKTEKLDYVKLNREADAWFATHRIEDFKDGKFVGKEPAKTITIPQRNGG